MSESLFPPFLQWGQYKSSDEKNPDVVTLKVTHLDTFETKFSINVEALIKENEDWNEIYVPLKSHESKNSTLLDQWTRAVKEGRILEGQEILIKTHMGKSKNGRNIRRFSLAKN